MRRAEELVAARLVEADRLGEIRRVAERYAVALTPEVAALIDPADPADPIAAQFVPSAAELLTAPEERNDPIGDELFSPVPGIVHRHRDRVLLKPTLICPVYCRFCFRRESVGKEDEGAMLDERALARALGYIREHEEVREAILTGGDPFVLSPRRLRAIVRALDEIPHLEIIRVHTRVPIVEPRRVAPALVAALEARKAVCVVLHANHPRELTAAARAAAHRLSRAGIPLLSQTVLLRGVNNEAAVLKELFRALVAMRVKPYYLHHPDLAPGTARFRVGIAEGRRLVNELRRDLSGLCQPTYVLDIPGGYGKVPLAEGAARRDPSTGGWIVTDGAGGEHAYPADPPTRHPRESGGPGQTAEPCSPGFPPTRE